MTPSPPPRHSFQAAGESKPKNNKELGKTKQQGSKPVLWVDLFRNFNCQTEGRSPPLRKCTQCETAYYCSRACQRAHWKIHKPICIAAVAAKAQDATRQGREGGGAGQGGERGGRRVVRDLLRPAGGPGRGECWRLAGGG